MDTPSAPHPDDAVPSGAGGAPSRDTALALTNSLDAATDGLLDTILATERVAAGVFAMRVTAIAQLFEHILTREAMIDAAAGRPVAAPGSVDGWNAETRARRVAASELACAMRISERQATDLIEQSRTLHTRLPLTRAALAEGRIGYAHAAAMVDEAATISTVVDERDRLIAEGELVIDDDSANDTTADESGALPTAAEVVAEFERQALRHAEATSAGRFRQRARRLRERLEPLTREHRCAERHAERGVWVEPARDGMAYLTAFLPAADAHAAYNRISEIAGQLGRTDRRDDSIAGVDGDPTPPDDRTLPQRRADVLRDLLFDGVMPVTGTGTGIRPTVLVTVPVMTLLGRHTDEHASIEGQGPIPDAEARRLAAAAPADNLAHLCPSHHRLEHRTRWRVYHDGGRTLLWTAPSGRTYRTEPAHALPWG